jgi:hypothetical protein
LNIFVCFCALVGCCPIAKNLARERIVGVIDSVVVIDDIDEPNEQYEYEWWWLRFK